MKKVLTFKDGCKIEAAPGKFTNPHPKHLFKVNASLSKNEHNHKSYVEATVGIFDIEYDIFHHNDIDGCKSNDTVSYDNCAGKHLRYIDLMRNLGYNAEHDLLPRNTISLLGCNPEAHLFHTALMDEYVHHLFGELSNT